MKAILIREDGGPEVLLYEDVPDPEPGPGEVLVRMRFASLNHLDVWTRKGLPSVPKPRILGADGSGVVEALGDGVEGLAPGDAVVINPGIEHGDAIHVIGEHTQGVHAELAAIPATNVAPLRDGVSFEEAAAFPLVYETAYRMLVTRAHLQRGRVGAGLGHRRRRRDRRAPDRAGARRADDRHLVERREARARRPRSAPTSWSTTSRATSSRPSRRRRARAPTSSSRRSARRRGSARSTRRAPGGRVVVCGATSGPNPPAALHRLWWKQLDLLGSTMGTRADFEGAYDLVAAGAKPVIDTVFPLAEARAAHERLECGEQFGKILLDAMRV